MTTPEKALLAVVVLVVLLAVAVRLVTNRGRFDPFRDRWPWE